MSMQVTSNTVATTSSNLNGVGDSAPATTNTGSSPQLPPQYQLNFGGLTRASGLGLAAPSSVGDVEILFAQIASQLKDTLNEASALDRIGRSESRRGQLGMAMAAFDQMIRWGQEIDVNRENIKVQNAIITTENANLTTQTGQLQSLEGSRNSLISQRDGKQGEIGRNNDSIRGLDQRAGELRTELGRLQSPRDNVRIGQINGELTNISTNRQNLVSANGRLESEVRQLNATINGLDGQISAKKDEIKATEDKIKTATDSKTNSEKRVDNLLRAASNFFSNFVQLFIMALGGVNSENARDSGVVDVEGDAFESVLGNVASALVDLGANLSDLMRGSDTAVQSVGSGLNLELSSPERFGQASAPVARAMAFAGMIAGTMGAIADLLRNASAGMAMQNAGSFAAAGESRVRVPV